MPGSPTSFTGLSNYDILFTSQAPGCVASIIDTLIFVVGVTVVQNTIGMALAHRLVGDTRTSSVLRILVFFPIVLGAAVIGIVWLLLFDPLSSPAQAFFGLCGIQSALFGSNSVIMPLNVLFAVVGSLTTYNLIYILTDGQFGTNTLGMLAFNTAFGQTADLGLRGGGDDWPAGGLCCCGYPAGRAFEVT